MKVRLLIGISIIGLNLLLAGCAPKTTTIITSSTTPVSVVVPEEKAIQIASAYVPHDMLSRALVTTSVAGIGGTPTTYGVNFSFSTTTLTREQLVNSGWQADENTVFDISNSPDGTFNRLSIVVDINTGAVISKEAYTGYKLGPTTTNVK